MQKKKTYTELSKAQVSEKRFLVISKNETDGGFTMAQQVMLEEGKKTTSIFLKGACHIDTEENLYNLRDALNEAIAKLDE